MSDVNPDLSTTDTTLPEGAGEPTKKPEERVPLGELLKARERMKAAEDAAAAARAEAAAAAAKAAEADTLRERVAAYEAAEAQRAAALTARNTERTAALPEDLRALVPDGLPADTLAAWLDRAEKAGAIVRPQPAGGRAPGGDAAPKGLTEDEKSWIAEKYPSLADADIAVQRRFIDKNKK